jgi:hypothetical protein
MPIILATQELQIKRTEVKSQPQQVVLRPYFKKAFFNKKRAGGVIPVPQNK